MKNIFVVVILSLFAQQGNSQQISNPPENSRNILLPNAFSPNNDDVNDYFKLINFKDAELLEFKVFNRWGTILFSTNNPEQGWDGKYKGQNQPIGVYGHVIRVKYRDGIIETYRGTVTLIR